MRKEAVKVTPGDIIAPEPSPAPEGSKAPRAKPKTAKTATSQAAATSVPPETRAPAAGVDEAGPAAAEAAPDPSGPDPAATRRNFFRLDVFDVHVRFELEAIGDQVPKPVTVRGSLADVSAGGLRLAAHEDAGPMPDWPVRSEIVGRLQFELLEDEPPFDLPGRLVRRVETTSGFELAFSWSDPPQAEIDRLVHDLYQLEVRRRAAIPDDRRASRKPQRAASRSGSGHRQPALIGAALGLGVAIAVYETVAVPVVTPVLGVAAVVLAAAYFLVGA